MNDSLKVSIVTVSLNKKEFLEDCITSLINQTYKNIEYVIIDGGSNDGSLEIFNKYRGKIKKLVAEKDNGIFDAMNKGIDLASGEIVYFLNSDDRFFDNNVVENVVKYFTEDETVDFIYGNIKGFNPSNNFEYIEKYPDKATKWFFIMKTLPHPGTFFRSRCFVKAGKFDTAYKIASDYKWYLGALFVKKLKSRHVNDNISIFRLGGVSNNSMYSGLYFSERKAIQKKYFNNFELICANGLEKLKRVIRCLKMKT